MLSLANIKKFMDSTEKHVVEQNMARVNRNCEEQSNVEIRRMEMNVRLEEMNVLLEEKKKWEEEKKTLKEEKKKLKYSLFDLLKANDANKEKMKRI
jgi:hypothetical protein